MIKFQIQIPDCLFIMVIVITFLILKVSLFNDGTLTKNDETIYPDKTTIIENGKLTIHLERVNEPFTIIYHREQLSQKNNC